MPTIIYLLRHGEYDNPKDILPIRLPGFPLNQKGRQQAYKNAKYLKNKKIAAIYSSPILRCKQTSEIIGKTLRKRVHYSKLILEVKSPIQGMEKSKYYKLKKKYIGIPYSYPDHIKNKGETIMQIYKRIYKLVFKIINKHLEENVVVVAHGDPIMILIYGLVNKNYNLMLHPTKIYIPKGGMAKLTFLGRKFLKFEQINY
jgi:broad specificity phosphatase PhoE